MFNKIATVTVYVDDQEASEKFWVEKIGFEVQKKIPMGPNAHWIELSPPGAVSCITLYPKSMMEGWNQIKVGVVFQTNDIQNTYSELRAKGVNIDEPKELGFGIFTSFRDIDGNEFGLREHK
ncbi:VOC family protein [Alicyclobacillus dauci]|uniref:VOC family protein n=1 Tax=Alicyclobacillus dauci TaxID=1475485 RepID=A0ABY6Z7M0_9BACL|nr:VOC family protein [Alicyclobacillus dauci]WAH38881.1 VOC family protein [Alicyclobacillus dauci]